MALHQGTEMTPLQRQRLLDRFSCLLMNSNLTEEEANNLLERWNYGVRVRLEHVLDEQRKHKALHST